MKSLYIILILIIPAIISAQTVQLRGKVIDINKQPVNNLPIRFTSFGEAVTTSSGEFVITIPLSVQFIDVVIRDNNWQILYPVDAKVPVPADPNFVTTIIVSGSNTSAGRSMDESIIKFNKLESLLRDIGTTNTELSSFLERFIELEAQRLEISEVELRQKFEKKEKRDALFTEISPVLNEYILRLDNLKTNFEMYYESAFVLDPSVEHLNSAIKSYNPSFDTIYNNHNKWQNQINSAWDAVLSESFASSIDYMIDEVHTPYVFQLNECIKVINNIRSKVEIEGKSPEEQKSEVRTTVSAILKSLKIKIPILENRYNELITRLQHSEIN